MQAGAAIPFSIKHDDDFFFLAKVTSKVVLPRFAHEHEPIMPSSVQIDLNHMKKNVIRAKYGVLEGPDPTYSKCMGDHIQSPILCLSTHAKKVTPVYQKDDRRMSCPLPLPLYLSW